MLLTKREDIDLMTALERRNAGAVMLGASITKAICDVKDRINAFHYILDKERSKVQETRPNTSSDDKDAIAKAHQNTGEELAQTIKMLESLVKQYVLFGGIKDQDELSFALGVLSQHGYKAIPGEVYQKYASILDQDISEYLRLQSQNVS
jgi:hypothetical protein